MSAAVKKRAPTKPRRYPLDHLSDSEIIEHAAKLMMPGFPQWSNRIQRDIARRLRRIVKDYAI